MQSIGFPPYCSVTPELSMDAWKAKRTLMGYTNKEAICNVFERRQGVTKQEVDSLWDGYLEFMVIKALGNDVGLGNSMRLVSR